MKLTNDEHGLVFDYYFRCAGQERVERGSELVTSNPKAAHVYSCMEQALAQLNHMKEQDCPEQLVDLTLARLKLATVKKVRPHKNGL